MNIEDMCMAVEEAGYMQRSLSSKDIKAIQQVLRAAERMRNSQDAFDLRDAELAFDDATKEQP
jgi:hypothetical protein